MPLPLYEAVAFNTTTNLIDIIGVFPPSLVYPNTVAEANQNLAAGALVSLVDIGGTVQVINAFALNSQISPAVGFVLTAVAPGQPATVFTVGNYLVSGSFTVANIGQTVYLSAVTPGQPTLTAPNPPNLIQTVGTIVAVSAGVATISFSSSQSVTGVVTSVGLSLPSDFIVSGSPVTSAGTLTAVWADTGNGLVFAGPASATPLPYGMGGYGLGTYGNGSEGPPEFRSLVIDDLFGGINASDNTFLRGDGTWQQVTQLPESLDLPNLTTSLPITTLYTTPVLSPPSAELFRISLYEECTVAGNSAGMAYGSGFYGQGVYNIGDDNVQVQIGWTDDVGPRVGFPVTAPLDLGETNAASGSIIVRSVPGSSITYQASLTNSGSPTYGLFFRVERL
jgi:hypothetical protein